MKTAPLLHLAFIVAALSTLPLLAARPQPSPPSEAQKERWRERGRDLPAPELLQPTLDSRLRPYVPRSDLDLVGTFEGTSSDVLVDLTWRWIAAFQRIYPRVSLKLNPPYAGSLGARELIKGDLDFVMVSRELKPDDLTDFRARFGYDPFSVPILGGSWRHFGFLDSVVFFVHEDNPLRRISYDQLDALLSTTRHRGGAPIRTWGQLGLTGEWAEQPIKVWAIQPWNGFEEFVRQRALSVGDRRGEWRPDLNFVKTVFPVSGEVAADRYAIGYAGLAYVGPGVKQLAIAAEAGGEAILPGYEEVALARYPLSRLCFMNLNRSPGQPINPVLGEFLRFILSREGQRIVQDQGIFLPLRADQATASAELVGP